MPASGPFRFAPLEFPVKISQLVTRTIEVKVPFGESAVTLVVDRMKRTPTYLESLDQKTAREVITDLVVSWDLEDEDGQVLPLQVEALADVPMDVLRPISRAALEGGRPNSE